MHINKKTQTGIYVHKTATTHIPTISLATNFFFKFNHATQQKFSGIQCRIRSTRLYQ